MDLKSGLTQLFFSPSEIAIPIKERLETRRSIDSTMDINIPDNADRGEGSRSESDRRGGGSGGGGGGGGGGGPHIAPKAAAASGGGGGGGGPIVVQKAAAVSGSGGGGGGPSIAPKGPVVSGSGGGGGGPSVVPKAAAVSGSGGGGGGPSVVQKAAAVSGGGGSGGGPSVVPKAAADSGGGTGSGRGTGGGIKSQSWIPGLRKRSTGKSPDKESPASGSTVPDSSSTPHRGSSTIDPNPPTTTLQNVRDFSPQAVVSWLTRIGYFEKFNDGLISRSLKDSITDNIISGTDLLEKGHDVKWLEVYFPPLAASDLAHIVQGLYLAQGIFLFPFTNTYLLITFQA